MTFALSRPRLRRAVLTLIALTVAAAATAASFAWTQSASAQSATITVATNGNDANPGTEAPPLRPSSPPSTWRRPAPSSRSAAARTPRAPTSRSSRTALEPAHHDAQLQRRARDHRRREHAVHPGRGGLQHPPGRPRRPARRGRLVAVHRPGDHQRPVRHLRPGHQQRPSTSAWSPATTTSAACTCRAPRPTTRSSTWTATATATRATTARAPTAWPSRRARAPATSSAARGCGTTPTTASTPGSSSRRSRSRTASPTATGSTAGTCPTTPATATGSRWAAATPTWPRTTVTRNSMAWDNAAAASSTTATPARRIDRNTAWRQRHRLRLLRRRRLADPNLAVANGTP